jgi:hypothetical protein
MPAIIQDRVCAEIEGEFVIFLIGMRINQPWKFWKWMPVAAAMPKMLIELAKNPELGLLHARTSFGFPNIIVTQYWRSFDALEAYARSQQSEHLPEWVAFNKAVGTNGEVGIWHETYVIRPDSYESVYANMPAFGLGLAGKLIPAKGHRNVARERLKEKRTEAVPVAEVSP